MTTTAPPSSTIFITTTQDPVVGEDNVRPAYRDKTQRIAVPAMPMPFAVICCILNFALPGFGTICAGFTAFCCSRNEDIDRRGRCISCMTNWGIGVLQFIACFVCFVGWFWSCAWGVLFLGMSAEYYHNNRIAADGGYFYRNNRAVIATVVTRQPEQQTTSLIEKPPTNPDNPPPETEKTSGPPPEYTLPPPPPHLY